jgi:hypothetical protein
MPLIPDAHLINSTNRRIKEASKTFTIDTTGHAVGDQVGDKEEFVNVVSGAGLGGVIRTIVLTDLVHTTPVQMDIIFFRSDPSTSTLTENSPPDVADGEVGKIAGKCTVLTGDWIVLADNAVATITPDIQFTCESTSLYVIMITRTAKTWASASDLAMRVSMEIF